MFAFIKVSTTSIYLLFFASFLVTYKSLFTEEIPMLWAIV